MKKCNPLIVALTSVGLALASGSVFAQNTGRATTQTGASAASTDSPSGEKIGLIDMGHVFKNYEKFKDQTAKLQREAEAAEAKAQKMIEDGRAGQLQLQQLQPDSAEFTRVQDDLIKLKTELETFKQIEQQKIARQQAEVYKQIYSEVQTVVDQYATHFNFTLVMRFNRAEVAEAGNPNAVLQNMNRQVVYHMPKSDITDAILNYMNSEYKKTASK